MINKLLFLIIVVFPVKGLGYLSGIPYNTKTSFLLLVLMILCIFKIEEKNLKISYLFFSILFLFKVFFLVSPPNLWLICVDDSSTPVQSSFTYEYYDSTCSKSFNNLNSIFTNKVEKIEFKTLDENYQWLGANSSNFPLGFLNHSKFNIYELRRDWLPFKMKLYKELDKNTSQLEINYIGEVTVKFNDGSTGYGIPTRYLNENTVTIDVPKDATHVIIKYSYLEWKIKHIPTLKSGYPYEKFAKLVISENGSSREGSNFYSFIVIFTFLVFNLKNITVNINRNYLLLFLLTFVLSLIYNLDISQSRFIKIYAYLCLLLIYLYFNSSKFSYFNFVQIFILLSFIIIDYPWNTFDLIVKPGGSDSLTYENQARLIFEGDGLRGGSSVFLYSPGYRYFLYLLHLIFGDFWNVVWIAMLSLCVNLIFLCSKNINPISFLFVIFLISDNVRNIFLYGMSEASSLMLFLISIYMLKRNKITIGIFLLALGVLIRPETGLFALGTLFFYRQNITFKKGSSFFLILLLPLIHNLYFGKEFVLITTGWNYGRNLDFDLLKNLNYIIINPLNEKILMTLGPEIIYIGFSIFLLSNLNFLISIVNSRTFQKNDFYILGLLNLIPFLIYDPELFYPRHIIIGLCFLSLNSLYNDEQIRKLLNKVKVLN
tara:strand:+ start:407 stop:2374 length:1968 start_codon:yes stop_codon:yes gene_type:complete